jgi:hypothetical protein
MDVGTALWLVMTLGGASLLGVAIAYGVISTRRRQNALAQRVTEAGTRDVYRREEERRADLEEDGAPVAARSRNEMVTATEARQGAAGYDVSAVLAVSLLLAVLAGIGLFGYLWL